MKKFDEALHPRGPKQWIRGHKQYDLVAPTVTTNPNVQPATDLQSPPEEDSTVLAATEILLAGLTTAATVSALTQLLAPQGISEQAVQMAYGVSGKGTTHIPNSRLDGTPAGEATKLARSREGYFRAAYIINASKRIEGGLRQHEPVKVVLEQEEKYYRQHEGARRNRLESATQVQKAANVFGPLLGWYHNPLINNEIECLTASGHNFYAELGTMIGYPGSVHPHCGCEAGPPIPGAGMVNDALALLHNRPRSYKVKANRSTRQYKTKGTAVA